MIHTCCPSCRLRFTPAAGPYLDACPECGDPIQPSDGAEQILGFRLVGPEDLLPALPDAIAVSIPPPEPGWAGPDQRLTP